MKRLFKITYGVQWPGMTKTEVGFGDSANVVAFSAGEAINKLVRKELRSKCPRYDENGDEIPGKYMAPLAVYAFSVEILGTSIDVS